MGHQFGPPGNTSKILYKCLSEKNSCVSGLLFLLQVIEIDHDTTLTCKTVGYHFIGTAIFYFESQFSSNFRYNNWYPGLKVDQEVDICNE